ncbi:DUF3844 domain-containing protein [Aspergillus lucknowensis]|uniref:Vacuolar sorting protein Vps3844 C-terminal domain-containing protein n=1 Tax=Aspergillus lucknowensis TaxID=176173 RepID=A0ABR4LZD0_9EURO
MGCFNIAIAEIVHRLKPSIVIHYTDHCPGMHFFSSFLVPLAAVIVETTAFEASVFTFGPAIEDQGPKPSVISSATLEQLLELRFGSSTTSTLERLDEDSIESLGKLAGPANPLFGSSTEGRDPNTIFIILEGLSDDIDSSIRNGYQSELVTSTFPTTYARDAFFDSLLEAGRDGILGLENKHCTFSGSDAPGLEAHKNAQSCLSNTPGSLMFSGTFHDKLLSLISTGEAWLNEHKKILVLRIVFEPLGKLRSPSAYLDSIHSFFSELHSFSLSGKRITAAVLPSSNVTNKSIHLSRGLEVAKTNTNGNSARNARPVAVEQVQVPLAVAPLCYASNSSCNEATNSCSGHGVCYRKSGSESEAASGDCYACRCHETLVKNEDGTEQRARWGGSACQKRDVSSPFFLISGVTVAIMITISTAVGMMYSVGATELPGVIGAGVGAPRAQK